MIFDMTKRAGGGGSGGVTETLIGSGTHTVANAKTNAYIPVTYNGTPTMLYVVKDEPDAGVGETLAWVSILADSLNSTVATGFLLGVRNCKIKSSADVISYMSNFNTEAKAIFLSNSTGTYQPDGDYITINQYGNNNKIQAGGYHWYIYGTPST